MERSERSVFQKKNVWLVSAKINEIQALAEACYGATGWDVVAFGDLALCLPWDLLGPDGSGAGPRRADSEFCGPGGRPRAVPRRRAERRFRF